MELVAAEPGAGGPGCLGPGAGGEAGKRSAQRHRGTEGGAEGVSVL